MEIEELGLPDSIKEFDAPENFHKNKNEEYDYDAYQYEFVLLEDTIIDDVVVFPCVPATAIHLPLLTTSPRSSALFMQIKLLLLNSVNNLLDEGIAGV